MLLRTQRCYWSLGLGAETAQAQTSTSKENRPKTKWRNFPASLKVPRSQFVSHTHTLTLNVSSTTCGWSCHNRQEKTETSNSSLLNSNVKIGQEGEARDIESETHSKVCFWLLLYSHAGYLSMVNLAVFYAGCSSWRNLKRMGGCVRTSLW